MKRTAGVFLALAVVAALVAGGCSGGDDTTAEESSRTTEASTTTITLPDSRPVTVEDDGSFLVGQSIDAEIHVWDEPGEPDDFSRTLKAADETSGILTFLVEERRSDGWLEVHLPGPPVGSTGFVVESDLALTRHRYDIEVSRSAHTLKVLANGVETFDEKVAIGPDTPPAGTSTYIKEVLLPPEGSVYNPQAYTYGLAGGTNTPQQFADGRGVVAIHAVLDPATLGHDAPNGAIGMDRGVLERLYENIKLPLGTPVEITD
jgi:L,D-transpeptidase-like protein